MKNLKNVITAIVLVLCVFASVNAQQTFTATLISLEPVPGIAAKNNPSTCGGVDGSITASGGVSYSWTTAPVQNTAMASALTAGTYTVTVTNGGGCTHDTTVTISDPGAPVVTLASSDADNTFCAGVSVTFTAGGGCTNYNFKVNGVSVQNGASNTYITALLVNGDAVSVTGTLTGCTGNAAPIVNTVNANPLPSIIAKNNPTICGGSDGSITASGAGVGGSYSWNSAPVQNTAAAVGLIAGAYMVHEINAAGCSHDTTVTISDPGAPVVTLASSDADNTFCAGVSVTFTAGGGCTNYDFKVNGVSIQNGASNTYVTTTLVNGDAVSVTGTLTGCTGNAAPIVNTVHAKPIATLVSGGTNVNIPCVSNVGLLTIAPSAGLAPYTVQMTTNTGYLVAPNNNPTVVGVGAGGNALFNVKLAAVGVIPFQIVVTDANGCSN